MFDGSFSPDTLRMGTAFIAHHHHLGCTHVNSKGHASHDDNSSMLAEARAFEDALNDALALNSKSIHITGDSKTLIKLGLGKDMTLGKELNIFLHRC
jgi:ribonuclease HI